MSICDGEKNGNSLLRRSTFGMQLQQGKAELQSASSKHIQQQSIFPEKLYINW